MYDTAEYTNSRLQNTIVRRLEDNEPIFVLKATEDRNRGIKLHYDLLSNVKYNDRHKGVATIYLKDVNISSPKLGFSQTNYGCSYTARRPIRNDYRQGLRNSNWSVFWGQPRRFISDAALRKTIIGQYPPIELAIDESCNNDMAVAFSRDFAVHKFDGISHVFYKFSDCVGEFINGRINLKDEFVFLNEAFERSVNND